MQNMGYNNCPKQEQQNKPLPGDCFSRDQVSDLFDAVNEAVNLANDLYPSKNEGEPGYIETLDISHLNLSCLDGTVLELAHNKLAEIVNKRKGAKRMWKANGDPWPLPYSKETHDAYEDCGGYWDDIESVYGCTNSMLPGGNCIDYLDFRGIYKAAKCLATQNCRPPGALCRTCPICIDECWCAPCGGCYLLLYKLETLAGTFHSYSSFSVDDECPCDISKIFQYIRFRDSNGIYNPRYTMTLDLYMYSNAFVIQPIVVDHVDGGTLKGVKELNQTANAEPHYMPDICADLNGRPNEQGCASGPSFSNRLYIGAIEAGSLTTTFYANNPPCGNAYSPAFGHDIKLICPNGTSITLHAASPGWSSGVFSGDGINIGCGENAKLITLIFSDVDNVYKLKIKGNDGSGGIGADICGSPISGPANNCKGPAPVVYGSFETREIW